jgi:hypothetical protein
MSHGMQLDKLPLQIPPHQTDQKQLISTNWQLTLAHHKPLIDQLPVYIKHTST